MAKDKVLRKPPVKEKNFTLWVVKEYFQKRERLKKRGVLVSDHLRDVIYQEIDRLWKEEGLGPLDEFDIEESRAS